MTRRHTIDCTTHRDDWATRDTVDVNNVNALKTNWINSGQTTT